MRGTQYSPSKVQLLTTAIIVAGVSENIFFQKYFLNGLHVVRPS